MLALASAAAQATKLRLKMDDSSADARTFESGAAVFGNRHVANNIESVTGETPPLEGGLV